MEKFFGVILTFIAIGFISMLAFKEQQNSNSKVIKLPKIYFWMGIFILVFILVILIALLFSKDDSIDWKIDVLVFSLAPLLPLYVIFSYINWRIEIVDQKFIYQTFYKRKFEAEFEKTRIVKWTKYIIIIDTGEHKGYIDPNAIGLSRFLAKVKRKR